MIVTLTVAEECDRTLTVVEECDRDTDRSGRV